MATEQPVEEATHHAQDLTAHQERLNRVLTFLALSGGAALLHRRRTGIVASVGEVDLRSAIAARHTAIAPTDQVISLNLQSLIADVSPEYRLLVHVPAGADHAFADRMKRAIDLLQQHVFPLGVGAPPIPPAAAPANAFVERPARSRRHRRQGIH